MTLQRAKQQNSWNVPLYALGSVVLLVGMLVLGLIFVDLNEESTPVFTMIIAIVGAAIPACIAAAFAERAAKDIRNGTVQQKAKEGTEQALAETGVIDTIELVNPAIAGTARELLQRQLMNEQEERENQ